MSSKQGVARLMCDDCQHEVGGVSGRLSEDEDPELGRLFFPETPFSCPECWCAEFGWLEFKELIGKEE